MRDRSDRYQVQRPLASTPSKRIGSYFVEAGLLTPDQVSVILNDQQATGMRFGEIVVARGWLKEQTIEWVVMKVVEPERQSVQPTPSPAYSHSIQSAPPLKQNLSSVQGKNSTFLEQAASKQAANKQAASKAASAAATSTDAHPTKPFVRRDIPISKPLPSVGSTDSDVNWVG